MRTKQTIKNIIATIVLEIVTAIVGIIVPRFFTQMYGSAVNGLVSSISQFITYMGLVEAGVSSAGVVELYKPLAESDEKTINGIVSGIKSFYQKSGLIFLALGLLLVFFYPYIVQNEIADFTFIRLMIIVLSMNGIIDYFILGKYRVLLLADQRNYIIAFFQILGMLIIMLLSIILIQLGVNALIVKAMVPIVYLARTLAVVLYVKKKYKYINFDAPKINTAFKQKKSAFLHQIVGMICNNTDMVLLTVMLKEGALVEVSVYSVYNYVVTALSNFFYAISLGIRSSFGQVIAQEQKDTLRNSYDLFELLYIIVLTIVSTCLATLLYSFVFLYCSNFADAINYPRWELVIVFTVCCYIQNLRIPGMTIQIAAGHFSQTQWAAIVEALLNILISIALIGEYGILGVLIGTCISYLFRTIYIYVYLEKKFLPGSIKKFTFRMIRSGLISSAIICIFIRCFNPIITNWIEWLIVAIEITVISTVTIVGANICFEPHSFFQSIKMVKQIIHRH